MIFSSLTIKLINLILKSNQSSRHLLAKHQNKAFCLNLPAIRITAEIDIDGYLITATKSQLDVIINVPVASTTFLIDQDKLSLYKKLSFDGETKFGRELLEILANLKFDGISDKINSPIMLLVINKLTNALKIILEYLKLVGNNSTQSIKEYLLYETQDLITQFENEEFCEAVDQIKARTEILEQKIQLLLKQGTIA